ncbi:MAG: Fur family transcriptional regulator [Candidatus Cryptobacteroides sp.]
MNEVKLLDAHGIAPTANRIIILRTMLSNPKPLSMAEIGDSLETVDKSVISRTLGLFRKHHLVHVLEDGSDSTRYEVCLSPDPDSDDDEHVHFHCEKCGRTFCFEDMKVPHVRFPEGFSIHFTNYMAKGLCPDCVGNQQGSSVEKH